MTLFEFIVLVSWATLVFGGVLVGVSGSGYAGALLGGGIAVVVPLVVIRLVLGIWRRTSGNRPRLPRCYNGNCDTQRYQVIAKEGQAEYRCECGDRYLFAARPLGVRAAFAATRFMRITSQGVVVPFMTHTTWGPWEPDGGSDGVPRVNQTS